MFRGQFLMLRAIFKVMELFGEPHGAQKILNYRFWLLLSTKVAARLSKSVDERQKDTKTNFEVGFHFLKYCKGKGFGRRRQPQWLQWELCSCWLSVGSPANQHTLCHGCHWDLAGQSMAQILQPSSMGLCGCLLANGYWRALREHALNGAMRNLSVKAPWGSVEALHCVWPASVKAQVLKACGNRR